MSIKVRMNALLEAQKSLSAREIAVVIRDAEVVIKNAKANLSHEMTKTLETVAKQKGIDDFEQVANMLHGAWYKLDRADAWLAQAKGKVGRLPKVPMYDRY